MKINVIDARHRSAVIEYRHLLRSVEARIKDGDHSGLSELGKSLREASWRAAETSRFGIVHGPGYKGFMTQEELLAARYDVRRILSPIQSNRVRKATRLMHYASLLQTDEENLHRAVVEHSKDLEGAAEAASIYGCRLATVSEFVKLCTINNGIREAAFGKDVWLYDKKYGFSQGLYRIDWDNMTIKAVSRRQFEMLGADRRVLVYGDAVPLISHIGPFISPPRNLGNADGYEVYARLHLGRYRHDSNNEGGKVVLIQDKKAAK